MPSSVCQGLQSCLEPRPIEPRILMHRLVPSKPRLYQNQDQKDSAQIEKNFSSNYDCSTCEHQNKGGQLWGWSFIEALTNTSHNSKQGTETEQVYVHPLVKRSSSTLSMKSLEMCTESLGSETGSNVSESIDDFSSMLMEQQNIHLLQRPKSRESSRKVDRTVNFPPPLTSISGSDSFQVRPHREDGRLVLKAVTITCCSSPCFQAKRADGRLRLSFLQASDLNCDNQLADNEEIRRDGYADISEEEYCSDDDNNDADEDGEDEANGGSWEDGRNTSGKVEVGEFGRLSRCKEGGNGKKGRPNWQTFCVPIS